MGHTGDPLPPNGDPPLGAADGHDMASAPLFYPSANRDERSSRIPSASTFGARRTATCRSAAAALRLGAPRGEIRTRSSSARTLRRRRDHRRDHVDGGLRPVVRSRSTAAGTPHASMRGRARAARPRARRDRRLQPQPPDLGASAPHATEPAEGPAADRRVGRQSPARSPRYAVKDPALVYSAGRWHALFSAVDTGGTWRIGITSSHDLQHWSPITTMPHDPRVEGEASPDVVRAPDGRWVVTYQSFVYDGPGQLPKLYYRTTGDFTTFYEHCPVLRAPDEATRTSRLAISDLSARVLHHGLVHLLFDVDLQAGAHFELARRIRLARRPVEGRSGDPTSTSTETRSRTINCCNSRPLAPARDEQHVRSSVFFTLVGDPAHTRQLDALVERDANSTFHRSRGTPAPGDREHLRARELCVRCEPGADRRLHLPRVLGLAEQDDIPAKVLPYSPSRSRTSVDWSVPSR